MSENLLTPSVIKLFGRLVQDLQFSYDPNTVVSGYNNLLQRQLADGYLRITGTTTVNAAPPPANSDVVSQVSSMPGIFIGMSVTAVYNGANVFDPGTTILSIGPSNQFTVSTPPQIAAANINISVGNGLGIPNLARIYGFTFEGTYYGLPRPSIFLVHGVGKPVGNWAFPSTVEQSGVAAREWDFSGPTAYTPGPPPVPNPPSANLPQDLWYWEYEKDDFSIRFDTEAGPFEQILLVAMLRAGADMADRATPRSGASLSGASLAGASLSGASLSGASLSGASLSGASLRGR